MSSQSSPGEQGVPDEKFLLVDDAAQLLGVNAADLRRAIACGLIPLRQDNQGAIRVHRGEVPNDLATRLSEHEMDSDKLSAVYEDELTSLRRQLGDTQSQQAQLEQLLQRQADALQGAAAALEKRQSELGQSQSAINSLSASLQKSEQESKRLSEIIERTFAAIEQRENQVLEQTQQLTSKTDKAMELLQRALEEAESANAQVSFNTISASAQTAERDRLDQELKQRDALINNQHQLMERMVSLSEQSLTGAKPQAVRKKSFWQRLWGGGKGI